MLGAVATRALLACSRRRPPFRSGAPRASGVLAGTQLVEIQAPGGRGGQVCLQGHPCLGAARVGGHQSRREPHGTPRMPLGQHKDRLLRLDRHDYGPRSVAPGSPRDELVVRSLPVVPCFLEPRERYHQTLARPIDAPPLNTQLPDRRDHEWSAAAGARASPKLLAGPDTGWVRRQAVAAVADGGGRAVCASSRSVPVELLACGTHTLRRYAEAVDENLPAPIPSPRTRRRKRPEARG